MGLRRRDQVPPYEIMRSRGNAAPAPGGGASEDRVEEPRPVESHAEPASGGRGGASAPWWVGSSAPIVLRIPRGLAVAIVAGLLGLLVLAYFVGSVRGKAAAEAANAQQASAVGSVGPRVAPAISRQPPPEADGQAGPGDQQSSVEAERRKPGLNYLRLQTGARDEADRLAAFMADKGVTIQTYETRSGQYIVYAVDHGFRADELNSDSCLAYKRKLMGLGRAWKRFNNNRGTDLGTMYYELFTG